MPSNYSLTSAASSALEDVFVYTIEMFGVDQATAYRDGLTHTFETLVKLPRISKIVEELGTGLRQYRYRSHYVIYSIDDDQIQIEYILSTRTSDAITFSGLALQPPRRSLDR